MNSLIHKPTIALVALAACLGGCMAGDQSKNSGRYGDGDLPSAHDATRAGWPSNPEYQRTRLDAAVQEGERLLSLGDVAGARRMLAEVPATGLEDGRLHLLYARISMSEGRPQDVEWHLGEASVLMPRNGEVDLMRATFREVYGDWAAARDAFAEAAKKMPDDTTAIVSQARVMLALGEAEAAVTLLNLEIGSRPLSGELLRTAGFVKLAAGQFDEAARDFRDAKDLLPMDGRHLETMYLALARAGRYADVVSLVRQEELSELTPLALYTVGHSALLAQEAGLAVSAFQLWIGHDRGNPESWLDLARAHFQDEQYTAAFEAVTKVLRVRPDHLESLVLLGHIRSQVGQYAEAMATYREAARLGADGVVLAPVMLRLVDLMEGERVAAMESGHSTPGEQDSSSQVSSPGQSVTTALNATPTNAQQASGSSSSTRSPDSEAAAMAEAESSGRPLARTTLDPMESAQLMAGSRRAPPAQISAAPQREPEPKPESWMPELPDAGPAAEEGLNAFEGLLMPFFVAEVSVALESSRSVDGASPVMAAPEGE